MAALARGFDVVKFFPAAQAGGIAAVRALAGPFPQVSSARPAASARRTLPNGCAQPNVVSVGGSWLAPAADIRAGNWETITERARRAVAKLKT